MQNIQIRWRSKRLPGLTLAFLSATSACVADDELGTKESALSDTGLPDVPGVVASSNYGKYCSITDPTNGGWAFLPTDSTGDPCGALAPKVGPSSIVQRAGLWAINGTNNVMVQCDGVVFYGRDYGSAAITDIVDSVPPKSTNCVFNISPTYLPAFGSVFPSGTLISQTTVFDYNWGNFSAWNVADFGHTGSNACGVDRTGAQTNDCNPTLPHTGHPYDAVEYAYDWSTARDTPILAVADGVIRGSQQRTVWPLLGKWPDGLPQQSLPYSPQLELFMETQVGSGEYAEHFVALYHHMDGNPNTVTRAMAANYVKWGSQWLPPVGLKVHKGDVIGYVGESGASSGANEGDSSYHLDFSVVRLTNLTGSRAYAFQPMLTQYDTSKGIVISGGAGINGSQGVIDPFGWDAPQGIDPGAYKLLGHADPNDPPANVTQDGAFSIRLWTDARDFGLPHNGDDTAD